MKTYKSFLIRWWLIGDDSQDERSLFDIEHVQTGEHKRATNLTEVEQWMTSAAPRLKPHPNCGTLHSRDSHDAAAQASGDVNTEPTRE